LNDDIDDAVSESDFDSFTYNLSFASSDSTVDSYKTEKTVNSRKSHYNILPRRKCAGIGHPRLPPGLVSEEVDDTSVPESELGDDSESFLNPLSITPTFSKANFAEESGIQLLDRKFEELHGSTVCGFHIVNAASQLERTIDRWASDVLRIPLAPASTLQEAVLKGITEVGENAALFTDVRPTVLQYLLRHAMSEVVSEGVINSLVVSNAVEANIELTRIHERLLTRDVTAAAVWRRHTFSVAEENPTPEITRMIFERKMPLLAALLPDPLGPQGVLEDAFKFSCVLRGENADSVTLYRSFVPKLASTLDLGMVELVKPCRRSGRGEVDCVGATIFPGLCEILPSPPIVQTVVRRAQVICECELLATSNPV